MNQVFDYAQPVRPKTSMKVVAWIAFGFSLISLLVAVLGVLQIVMDKWRSGQRTMTFTVIQVHWTTYAFHVMMIVLAGVAIAGGWRKASSYD